MIPARRASSSSSSSVVRTFECIDSNNNNNNNNIKKKFGNPGFYNEEPRNVAHDAHTILIEVCATNEHSFISIFVTECQSTRAVGADLCPCLATAFGYSE